MSTPEQAFREYREALVRYVYQSLCTTVNEASRRSETPPVGDRFLIAATDGLIASRPG